MNAMRAGAVIGVPSGVTLRGRTLRSGHPQQAASTPWRSDSGAGAVCPAEIFDTSLVAFAVRAPHSVLHKETRHG